MSRFLWVRNGDIAVSIIDYGAAIQSVLMKDKEGHSEA